MVASGRGKSVVNFSPRFSLSHMTGSFSPNVMDGIQSVLGSSEDGGELRRRQAPGAVGGPGVAAAEPTTTGVGGKFAIPYPQQTGPTRYAPMPEKPGTTIKANSPTPQFPTSPYDIATAYLPPPTIDTTVSAPITYSTSSIENPVSTHLLLAVQILIGASAIGFSRTATECANETGLGKVAGLIYALSWRLHVPLTCLLEVH